MLQWREIQVTKMKWADLPSQMRSVKHLHPLHKVSVYKVGHSLTDAFTIFIIYEGAISIANIKL